MTDQTSTKARRVAGIVEYLDELRESGKPIPNTATYRYQQGMLELIRQKTAVRLVVTWDRGHSDRLGCFPLMRPTDAD